MRLLAIDPGPTHSAYVVIDTDDLKPQAFGKIPNEELVKSDHIAKCPYVIIEMIGHYGTGMPAGQTVFDTCVWIGRFWEATGEAKYYNEIEEILIKRAAVKAHLCGSAKAKDGNVIQALIDRFAPDTRNAGKGVKNAPGWFYGFHSDIWQAYALAVYVSDMQKEETA